MATKNTCFWMKSGLSMCTYCKLQGYDYNTVYHLADKFGLEPEEAIKRYLERRGKKDENNLKHTFRGVSLRKITTRQQYGRIMEYKHKHHIKYEESIIGG